ncbi:hypothetical protein FOC4_g10002759 [Fusarium odoratissimum]|uniref:Uncharacterized protein n=1 Tax=Fusarium oxysporum f. sp. cubense (strain race 4) TaxID=2502994 RepID=N1S918_FUSC4|nr:hypothetical protein FOC4_g10002759 [Fusarium odoratissimum]
MPRINISYSIFVQFLNNINKGIFRDASIDALGKVQKVHQAQSRFLIWYPDLTAVVLGPAKPPSHRYPSHNEIDLEINKLNPYRGPKDTYGMYHGVLVDAELAKADKEDGTGGIEEQMMEKEIQMSMVLNLVGKDLVLRTATGVVMGG